jgi:hypothetical protein
MRPHNAFASSIGQWRAAGYRRRQYVPFLGAAATALGPIALQSAASRKVHGAAGAFDLPLSLVSVTNPTTEPRPGPAATIVRTFNTPTRASPMQI